MEWIAVVGLRRVRGRFFGNDKSVRSKHIHGDLAGQNVLMRLGLNMSMDT